MIFGLLIGCLCIIYASGNREITAYGEESLRFDENGNLLLTTHDKKATGGIVYRTVGWTLKRYDLPIDAPGQQCAYIKLYDYGEVSVVDDPDNPGYVYCYYYGSREAILSAIRRVSAEWYHQLYTYGDDVYIDSILSVVEYGVEMGGLTDNNGGRWGEVYDTYEGIAGARGWRDKEALRSHFDKKAWYPAQEKQLQFYYETKVIDERTISNTPQGTGSVGAGVIGKENYHIERGIPTGESVYVNGDADAYAYRIHLSKIRVTLHIPICTNMIYELQYPNKNGETVSRIRSINRWYYVIRQTEYWVIHTGEIAYLNQILIDTYALEHGAACEVSPLKKDVSITKQGPYYTHIDIPRYDEMVSVGHKVLHGNGMCGIAPVIPDDNYSTEAQNAVGTVKGRSDRMIVGEYTLLSDQWGMNGAGIGDMKFLNKRISFYREGYVILDSKANSKKNTVSLTGEYIHMAEHMGTEKKVAYQCDSKISIHTPVAVAIRGYSDKKNNQLVNPETEETVFVIGKTEKLQISFEGVHRNLLGYGSQNYKQYVKKTELQCPFDVYYQGRLVRAGTWFFVSSNLVSLYLPVGILEGRYRIQVRCYAKNYKAVEADLQKTGENVNLDFSEYGAASGVDVRVIGRVYGFHVGDYYVGKKDENGNLQNRDYILPKCVEPAGQEAVKYGVPEGKVDFALLTVGDYWKESAQIEIMEQFYYVMDGERIPVNLYTYEDGICKMRTNRITLGTDNRNLYGSTSQYAVSEAWKTERGMQIWQGSFEFEKDLHILPATYNREFQISEQELIQRQMTNGTLIMNIEIYTKYEGEPELKYVNEDNFKRGFCSMWNTEGFLTRMVDNVAVHPGDTLLFRILPYYREQYRIVGTH